MNIELRDVVKRFGSLEAVSHVSLKIRDGELFTLLGPSGCGKTTVLRLIGGFHKPDGGEVFFWGEGGGAYSSLREKHWDGFSELCALAAHDDI
jgi:ABC-type Fe3+/spermidine/putrescine transport system ATPase subunit